MTPDQWARVKELAGAVLEGSRSLDETVGIEDDEVVRSAVERLVRHDKEAGSFLTIADQSGGNCKFTVGQLVSGRYLIAARVGRGGMGEVYRAEDRELGGTVALKTIVPEYLNDTSALSRFKREIVVARMVTHPNVCRVFDVDQHIDDSTGAKVDYLTMEFLNGETLCDRLKSRGRIPREEAVPLVRQIAEGIEAAHQAGIIHRDLKTSNVMLVPGNSGTERAVITDFGLAREGKRKAEESFTAPHQIMGTLAYLAPELMSGEEASVASDIYAFGVVQFEMATGRRPKSPGERAKQAVPDLDPDWDEAICRCLASDPGARFASAVAAARAMQGERFSGTQTIPLAVEPAPARFSRRAVIGAVVLAAALTLSGFAWKHWSEEARKPSAEALSSFHAGVNDIHGGAFFAATQALAQAVRVAPTFSLAHARLAEAWLELESSEKATREMLLAHRAENSGLSTLDRLQIEAVDFTVTREFDAAVAKYERMRLIAPSDPDIDLDLGRAYEKAGKKVKATESYLRAAHSATHNPAAWLRLAVLYSQGADAVKAEEAFRQAEELYRATSNLEGLTETAQQRGIAANGQGHLDEAKTYLTRAFESARMAGNLQQEISLKLRLSTNAYLSGDTPLAEKYASDALEAARANQMETLANRGIVNLGNAYFRKGEYAQAEKYYQESLSVAKRNGSARLTALSFLSLAGLHDQMKRSADAAREAQSALDFYQPNGFARETLQCLTILGRAQEDRGDYAGALKSFEKLLVMAESRKDNFQTAIAHESLGSVLADQENYPEALTHSRKFLEVSTDTEHAGYAAIGCGDLLWRLGRNEEASAMFLSAEAKASNFPPMRLALMRARAAMALSQEQFEISSALCRRIIASSPGDVKVAQASILLGLNETRAGHARRGVTLAETGLQLAGKLQDVQLLLAAEMALAEAKVNARDMTGALKLLHQTGPLTEALPLTRLLWLALLARADPENPSGGADAIQNQLRLINGQFGEPAFHSFSRRRDIQRLLAPLNLNAISKNEQRRNR